MGLLSILGKVGKAAAGFIPGVGPLISGGLDLVDGGGGGLKDLIGAGLGAAGSMAEGREKGRAVENANTTLQDNQRLIANRDFESGLQDRAKLDMDRREFAQKSRGTNFADALKSSIAMNLRDGAFNRPEGIPTISLSGGLRPSAMGEQGRAAAAAMNDQAMRALLAGETFDELPALERFTPTEMKKGGALDTILGIAGTLGKAGENLEARQEQNTQSSLIQKLLAQAQQDAASGVQTPTLASSRLPVPIDPFRRS